MPTGRRSSQKRPRNDLDDYLDEVDSLLFCVTKVDRQCLHRDLKAHVKELTTDPSSAERFDGRYGITKEQLRDEVSEPSTIAENYIASVAKKVPSPGLYVFSLFMTCIFIASIIVGIDRYEFGNIEGVSNGPWLVTTGIVHIITGACALVGLILIFRQFERMYYLVAYLSLLSFAISIIISGTFANMFSMHLYIRDRLAAHNLYSTLFMIDFVIIGMIGFYIYLRHYRVMNPKKELTV